jgi:hypothetical protein
MKTACWALSAMAALLIAGLNAGCSGGVGTSPEPAAWEDRLAQPSLTEDAFAALMAEAIADRLPAAEVTGIAPDYINITCDDVPWVFDVAGLWQECAAAPESRADACNLALAAFLETVGQETAPLARLTRDALRPTLRDEPFVRDLRQTMASKGGPVTEPLAGDLWVLYDTGREGAARFLARSEVKRLGLAAADLRGQAIENLRHVLPPVRQSGEGPVFVLSAGGEDDAALLLLDEVWTGPAKAVAGDLVVAVPTRNVVLFAGTGFAPGLQGLRRFADDVYKKSTERVSRTFLVRREGRWVGLPPPAP